MYEDEYLESDYEDRNGGSVDLDEWDTDDEWDEEEDSDEWDEEDE